MNFRTICPAFSRQMKYGELNNYFGVIITSLCFFSWELLVSAKLKMLSFTEENQTSIRCENRKTPLGAKVPNIGTTICHFRAARQLNQRY
jgi:hypothetical protein